MGLINGCAFAVSLTCLYQTHPWFTDPHHCIFNVRVYSCRSSTQFYALKELEHDVELTNLKIDGIQSFPPKAMNEMVQIESMELT